MAGAGLKMTSCVAEVFTCLAEDLQRLLLQGIDTGNEFYFQLPSNDKLEEWLWRKPHG